MDSQPLVVFCTCPDQASAERIAPTVVEERLAACVNILPGLTSVYRWRGQMQRDTELLLLVKTRGAAYPLLEARIRQCCNAAQWHPARRSRHQYLRS